MLRIKRKFKQKDSGGLNKKGESVLLKLKEDWLSVLLGFLLVALVVSGLITKVPWYQTPTTKLVEYPLWAVTFGLLLNALFSVTMTKKFIKPVVKTELFLKIGLVLMGASVNISMVASVGGKGIIQALIMITSVFFFTWWLGGKFKLPDTLRATMSTAISICGVSAAIAAAGAVLAKKEELAYVTALVIFDALILMVLAPWLAFKMGLTAQVAGAWFGGNIDTTAAVVGAGTIYGEEAAKVASIVKMSQNALIGVAAFLLALYFTTKEKTIKPSAKVIWERFPKFVLGFAALSVLASLGLFDKADQTAIKHLQNWAFALAFICIGLELSVGQFKHMGAKPAYVYVIATLFNTVLALGVSMVIFG